MLACFFVFAPILILTEAVLLSKTNGLVQKNEARKTVASIVVSAKESNLDTGSVFSPAEPPGEAKIKGSFIVADARPLLIRNYLEEHNSPLASFSDLIFSLSQEYGLDYRLIVAIAQQESNLCKKAPADCFNCWGVGIHSRGRMCFDSYPEAIEWVAQYLREEYFDKGLVAPEEIMTKYCPLSNGSWAVGIRQFMAEMD